MRTPFSKPQGRHAAGSGHDGEGLVTAVTVPPAPAAQLSVARRPVTVITGRAGIAAEVGACRQNGNGAVS
jgi:hypothetical protein